MTKRHAPEEDPPDDGDLFGWAERQGQPNEQNTIRIAFERFHASYPEVFALFERFTLEAIAAGATDCGAKAIWERVRWETRIREKRSDAECFRLNNNYTPYMARLFIQRHPEFDGLFATRKVRS